MDMKERSGRESKVTALLALTAAFLAFGPIWNGTQAGESFHMEGLIVYIKHFESTKLWYSELSGQAG